jgi:hypothetical protein
VPPGVEVIQHALQSVLAQPSRAVQHVGLQQIPQPRPVWRDQQLTALLKQIGQHAA